MISTNYVGTINNDIINLNASTLNNTIDISQGGTDTATGGSGNDIFLLGAAFGADDSINGGAGNDTLFLQGNYTTQVTLAATTLTNVETIVLAAGTSYNLALNDATIAAGTNLTVNASALTSSNTATISAASETNGAVTFLGGAGNDVFTGGSGNDTLIGNAGADILSGGLGVDTFVYRAASDSAFLLSGKKVLTSGADTINSFVAGSDIIDLSAFGFGGTSAASMIVQSTSRFTSSVSGNNTFFGTSGVVVEYSGGSARVYVDVNGDGRLGTGDGMIQLSSVANNSLTASSFKF